MLFGIVGLCFKIGNGYVIRFRLRCSYRYTVSTLGKTKSEMVDLKIPIAVTRYASYLHLKKPLQAFFKYEFLNSKQYRNSKLQFSKPAYLEFRISCLFSISSFGFRILVRNR